MLFTSSETVHILFGYSSIRDDENVLLVLLHRIILRIVIHLYSQTVVQKEEELYRVQETRFAFLLFRNEEHENRDRKKCNTLLPLTQLPCD